MSAKYLVKGRMYTDIGDAMVEVLELNDYTTVVEERRGEKLCKKHYVMDMDNWELQSLAERYPHLRKSAQDVATRREKLYAALSETPNPPPHSSPSALYTVLSNLLSCICCCCMPEYDDVKPYARPHYTPNRVTWY